MFVGFFFFGLVPSQGNASVQAALRMEQVLLALREVVSEKGFPLLADLDPYRTGLVGEEFTPLTTTLGEPGDKRTSGHPLFASALEERFKELGLQSGDVVAIGASGSFPGFLFATLAACNARGLQPLVICSLGSSMYGANRPGCTVVDMLRELQSRKVLSFQLLGYSLGGRNDANEAPLFPEWGPLVRAEAARLGAPFIFEANLQRSVERRMGLYDKAAGKDGVSCFVGTGGAAVTFGTGEKAASFPSGVTKHPFENMPEEGLLREFLERGVPVIHLLCVSKLCKEWNIPYDTNPFLWREQE